MDNGSDTVVRDDVINQGSVACAAGDKWHRCRSKKAESCRQIIEDDHRLARIGELMHHVAADIAGASGDQNGHCNRSFELERTCLTAIISAFSSRGAMAGYSGHS